MSNKFYGFEVWSPYQAEQLVRFAQNKQVLSVAAKALQLSSVVLFSHVGLEDIGQLFDITAESGEGVAEAYDYAPAVAMSALSHLIDRYARSRLHT